MAVMPEECFFRPTAKEHAEADELERAIDDNMRTKRGPPDASKFCYEFSADVQLPNERVQRLIRELYIKNNERPNGWSDVRFAPVGPGQVTAVIMFVV